MADNYTQFSFSLPATEEQMLWLKQAHAQCQEVCYGERPEGKEISPLVYEILGSNAEQEISGDLDFEFDKHSNELVVYAEQVGEVVYTAKLMQSFLKNFNSPDIVSFEWADTCSKMRPYEFGGGAVALSRNVIEIKSTSRLCDDLCAIVAEQDQDCLMHSVNALVKSVTMGDMEIGTF